MADKKSDAKFYGCRSVGGVTKVLPQKFYGITAIVGIVGFIILAVIPIPGAKGWGLTERIFAVSFFTLTGSPLLLFSFVLRYCLDSEKIVYINIIGIKKIFKWKDVKIVRISPTDQTNVKLYGLNTVIKIHPVKHFGHRSLFIKDIIRKYCTEAEWKCY